MEQSGLAAVYGGWILGLVIVGIIWLFAWILLPFAMFGIKPLLRDLLFEVKKQNKLLEDMRKRPDGAATSAPMSRSNLL